MTNGEDLFPYSTLPKVTVGCPICRQIQPSVDVVDRYGFAVKVATCCGMEFLAEQLTRAGYDALYAGPYRQLVAGHAGQSYVGPRQSKHTGAGVYTEFTRLVFGRRNRVLDAGGSSGVVGRALRPTSLTVLDPAAQELPTDATAVVGYLEDPIPGEYDLAICIETMDHLTDPLAALRNLRAVAPRLVLNFIDVAYARKVGQRPPVKIDHPLYWTQAGMQRALAATGWRPIIDRANFLQGKTRSRYLSTLIACKGIT